MSEQREHPAVEKLSFRQRAARKLEEAKRGAAQLLEEAEESATQAATAAKASYESYQLAGKYANEDKYAQAWREVCMSELQDPAAAQVRLHDYADQGTLEAENPMVGRAKKITAQTGADAATRLAEQDELVATMATSAKTLAEQQLQALQKIQEAAMQLMPAADQEQGTVAADISKILEACGSVDLAAWSDKITESIGLSEAGKSAAFAGVVGGELKTESEANAEAHLQQQDAVTKSLVAAEEANLGDAATETKAQERALVASQAKHTGLLVAMRTQAYTTSLDQLTAFVDAQCSFFTAGLAAMEALKPHVQALQARSEEATATAAAMKGKLDKFAATVEDESLDVPELQPTAPARTLRAGTSVLGKALGAPQFQGYLYRNQTRRWCVLINGKLYEYAEGWEEAPLGVTSMFLCNAKAAECQFGIELLSMNPAEVKAGSPPAPIVYQASSEALQQRWLKVITACTEFMITHPPIGDDVAVEENPQVTFVRSVPGNEVCADCSRESPEWVSVSLGVTVCSECSGAHRSLGTHISKVQSLALDELNDVTMELLKAYGNTFANSLWESAGVEGIKPGPSTKRAELAEFITAKYKDRKYVDSTLSEESDNALLVAVEAGDVRGTGRCLVGGCSVNATDEKSGKSALMIAVESGNLPCVELIANNGADLLATDTSGQTVLHQVVRAKNEKALRLIVKRGAWVSLDSEDCNGTTPRALAGSNDSEGFLEAMQDAVNAAEAKKAQESRMAAGKVYYDATRQLATGKITDAIAEFESGLELDPEHMEMEAELLKAREMQTSLGDEASEEAVASFEKKYKLKLQLSGGLAKAGAAATQAAEVAKVAARDAADTVEVAVNQVQGTRLDEFDADSELILSGFLEKKGARARDGFKKRWFELRGTSLGYFDKEGGKLKGHIPLRFSTDVRESTAEDAKVFEVEIIMSDRVYRLNCPDSEEREQWIRAMLGVQEKLLEACEPEQEPEQEPEPEPEPEQEPEQEPTTAPQMEQQATDLDAKGGATEEGIPPEQQVQDAGEVAVGTEIDDQVAI